MIFQPSDLLRIIIIYVVQLTVGGILFFLIALLVLRRSTKQLNQVFSMFFISIAVSTLINVIYATLRIPEVVEFLHILTYFFFCWAMVFLLLFNLMLLKSTEAIHRKNQLLFIVAWTLILSGLFPIGILGGVEIGETTNWKPVWSLPFFLYGMMSCVVFMLIPTYYYSFQVYNQFDNEQLEKRWKFFLFGIFFYYFIWAGASIVNYLAIDFIRTIWSIILLISFFAIYVLYYGVAKQLGE